MQVGLGNRQTENSYTVRRADNLNDKVKRALRKAVVHKETLKNLCQVSGKIENAMQKLHGLHSIFYFAKILGFNFSVFQRNAQPSQQVMISGVWGYVTNKRLRRFSGYGKSA